MLRIALLFFPALMSKLLIALKKTRLRFAPWNLNLEFSGLHYCLFVKVQSVVSATAYLDYHISFSLSTTFFIFFSFFESCPSSHLNSSKLKNGERGIWTLAPVARPTPLAGAPLRPLEYFSSSEFVSTNIRFSPEFRDAKVIIHTPYAFVNCFFHLFCLRFLH